MPELPEVETIRRDLQQVLAGKKIAKLIYDVPRMLLPSAKKLVGETTGKTVENVERAAKMLIWRLSGDYDLAFHLKMTGQLVYRPRQGKTVVGGHPFGYEGLALPNKFTHVIFEFRGGGFLYFNDIRKFGWIKLLKREALARLIKASYGSEPLTAAFTEKYFFETLARKPRLKIKQVLLDQKLIAGLGNIYVDEACFGAELKPTRAVRSLTNKEKQTLFMAIGKVLRKSIKARGTSFDTYRDGQGRKGGFTKFLKVYKQEGRACQRQDGGVIRRVVSNGRGTRYCPKCQK